MVSDARLFDLPAIRRLEQVCFPKDAYDIFTLLSLAVTPGVMRLKAIADDRLVGYLAGEIRADEATGWVITIGVLPRYQGRGIGRALLSSAEKSDACQSQLHEVDGAPQQQPRRSACMTSAAINGSAPFAVTIMTAKMG